VRESETIYHQTIAQGVDEANHKALYDNVVETLIGLGLEDEEVEEEDINIWEADALEGTNIIPDVLQKQTTNPDGTKTPVFETKPDGSKVAVMDTPRLGPDGEFLDIKAASLNKLVERVTAEKNQDMNFIGAFLMTYQSFTQPERLLAKLIQRYNVPKPEDLEEAKFDKWKQETVRPIQLRVINFIKKWMTEFFSDFSDKVIGQLRKFIDVDLPRDGNDALAKTLNGTLAKQLKGASEERIVMFNSAPPEVKVNPRDIFAATELRWEDIDELEIARQLTLLEFSLFSSILPSELLNQNWAKPKYKHRALHILQSTARFNVISGWAASQILKCNKRVDRVAMYCKMQRICIELRKLSNFSLVMAFIAGLNNSAIHRLNHTKSDPKITKNTTFDAIAPLMSRDLNSQLYRETLKAAAAAGPVIPYLGTCLTDLTFIDDGNQDNIEGLIHWKKRGYVATVIADIQRFQQNPYNLQAISQIQAILIKLQYLRDEDLYKESLKVEPRGVELEDLP
jgi:son of sevenless-like protein